MFAIFIAVGCIAIGQVTIAKGLILGTLFSILNFILIGETLPYRLGKSKKRSFFAALGSIYIRYIFLAIPVLVAIKHDTFNLFAVIAGIFGVQVVLLWEHVMKLVTTNQKR